MIGEGGIRLEGVIGWVGIEILAGKGGRDWLGRERVID